MFASYNLCQDNWDETIETIFEKIWKMLKYIPKNDNQNALGLILEQPGKPFWRGRLSTVDLIKIRCFVKKENLVSVWKAADLY